ncbi:MAG: hypothetical protein M3036_02955, partial [Bifidobacteriales bacterium]|nr:hypothetical protein [Bifidobacteriales bacterium]
RETRCMKPKPLHQTPSGTSGPLINVLFVGKPCCLSTPNLHRIAGTMALASRLLDIPRFSPYHPICRQHTRASFNRLATMILLGRGDTVVQSYRA